MKTIKLSILLFTGLFTAIMWAQESDRKQLTEDTSTETFKGNPFTAPADWFLYRQGPATILEPPEGNSNIVLVDVEAENDSLAVSKAWEVYKSHAYPILEVYERADSDGWSNIKWYDYQTSPNEKRGVGAATRFANGNWTVIIYDVENATGEKRMAQVNLIFSSLLPNGYSRESFAGKNAAKLDASKIGELTKYVERAMELTKVPGVGLGIIQDGSVVFAGGFGVRELGRPEKVDAETLFLIASNTKGLTTLMLAKLVDEGKIAWDTPVTEIMPAFRLGSEETTSKTRVEHLICACTGLPRKDMELIMEFEGRTAADAMARLEETEPTTGFGELYQYSNGLAAAAGYVGGHLLYNDMELGEAYDRAMQEYVFSPLGMHATTFDFEYAQNQNHAKAFGSTVDGAPALLDMGLNYAVIHVRPAGAAWSNVNDMLKYIAMELNEGKLPSGEVYISKKSLLERRAPKVPIRQDETYGMGLMVNNTYDIPVVHHGGDVFGHHSDMMWLPEHGVGAIVLTSGDPGWQIRSLFQRKLLEVMFEGLPEADGSIVASSQNYFNGLAASKKLYTIPADKKEVDKLSETYSNKDLGEIRVIKKAGMCSFDFGEWSAEVASRVNPDGSISFVTISPGLNGLEFVMTGDSPPDLILRDAQHEYIFKGK